MLKIKSNALLLASTVCLLAGIPAYSDDQPPAAPTPAPAAEAPAAPAQAAAEAPAAPAQAAAEAPVAPAQAAAEAPAAPAQAAAEATADKPAATSNNSNKVAESESSEPADQSSTKKSKSQLWKEQDEAIRARKKKHREEGMGYYNTIGKPEQDGGTSYYQGVSTAAPHIPVKPVTPPPPPPQQPDNIPAVPRVPASSTPLEIYKNKSMGASDQVGESGSITITRHVNKAKDFMTTGHYDLAKKHWREACRLSPTTLDYHSQYYEACKKANDWSEASLALEGWFRADPTKEKSLMGEYGQVLFKLRKYQQAEPVLKKAIALNSNSDVAHKTLLKIYLMNNDVAGATNEFNALLRIAPKDAEVNQQYGDFLMRANRTNEALPHYKLAGAAKPFDAALQARLGYILLYNKEYDAAVDAYTRAVQSDPNKSQYKDGLRYAQQQQQLAAAQKKKKS